MMRKATLIVASLAVVPVVAQAAFESSNVLGAAVDSLQGPVMGYMGTAAIVGFVFAGILIVIGLVRRALGKGGAGR